MSETTAPAPRKTKVPRINVRRRTTQWLLAPLVIITIGLGWKYPLVGLIVPTVMLIGIIGGIIRGRYVCGNLCPRGSFLDRMIAPISLKRPIPEFLRKPAFRWIVLAAMMGFMVFRISQNPSDIMHWGRVFWVMCLATTAIGVVLGGTGSPSRVVFLLPHGDYAEQAGGAQAHSADRRRGLQILRPVREGLSLRSVAHGSQGRGDPRGARLPEVRRVYRGLPHRRPDVPEQG